MVNLHVENVCKKMRQKYWLLRHLKKPCFNQEELVRVYQSSIVQSADYCSVVYHSLLNDELDEAI